MAKDGMGMADSKFVEVKNIQKAKEESKEFNEGMQKGEKFMNENREPFCRACMWHEFNQRKSVNYYKKSTGAKGFDRIEVPDWQEYAGKNKFLFVGKTDKKNRKEMCIDTGETYKCKNDERHMVSIMRSVEWNP